MISAVQNALNSLLGNVVALQNANGAGRAYELYIMTRLALELRTAGCYVFLQRSDGSIIRSTDADRAFIQRGGTPTGIFGAAQGTGNASSIVFQVPQSVRWWEIWNGIQFTGRSGGTHELDIAIVPRELGVSLRAQPMGGTPGGRPKAAIECKDVGSAGGPDEMRAFVARLYDLTILTGHDGKIAHLPSPAQSLYPCTGGTNWPYRSFWRGNRQTFNAIARRTGFAKGATAISGYYGIQPRGPLTPGSIEDAALANDLASWIVSTLR